MPVPEISEFVEAIKSGESARLVPDLERLARRYPTGASFQVLLALALEGTGQWTEALKAWQRAHFLVPNSTAVKEGIQRVTSRMADQEDGSAVSATMDQTPARPGKKRDAGASHPVQPQRPSQKQETDTPVVPEAAVDSPVSDPRPATGPTGVQKPKTEPGRSRPSPTEISDLDRLIGELSTARIVPTPDLDSIEPVDLDDEIEDVVSETLARIFFAQGQYHEAARVYEQLARQEPARSEEFLKKARDMKVRSLER